MDIADGKVLGVHILNVDASSGIDEHLIISLRQPYVIRLSFLKQIIQKRADRIRLNSPYLEHVAQSFATLYMRVGLPAKVDLLTS